VIIASFFFLGGGGIKMKKKIFVLFSDFVNIRNVHSLSGSEIFDNGMFEGTVPIYIYLRT